MESFFSKLLIILKGSADKRNQERYLWSIFSFSMLMICIAYAFYPTNFSILENVIDDLGSSEKNPIGSVFFGTGLVITGCFLISHFIYLGNHLYPTLRLITVIAIGSGILGSISIIWFGLVGEGISPWHDIAADFVFGDFVSCGVFLFFVLIRKKWHRAPLPRWRYFFLLYGISFLLVAGAAIVPNMDPIDGFDPKFFNWPVWQWITILNFVVLIFGIFYLVQFQE
jgi:hypothetical protein